MSRFGSFSNVSIFQNFRALENGMTAIAIVGTPWGFVIGADGRKRLLEDDRAGATDSDREREIENARKIFEIAGQNWKLAYAVKGFVEDTDGFDLIQMIEQEVRSTRMLEFPDSFKYVERLGNGISQAMNAAKQKGEIESFPEEFRVEDAGPWSIADIFFLGYFNGTPFLRIVRLVHYHQLSEVRWISDLRLPLLTGSDVIRDAMYNSDGTVKRTSPFAQFARPLPQRPTFREAEEYARGYIEACSSPLALQLDPKNCQGIGGHIHIAEVTPTGLKWREPPLH